MSFVFWAALLLIAYSYLVYPLLLIAIVRLIGGRPQRSPDGTDHRRPAVACIVAAYNEERHIAARIDNVLAQNYDPAKLRVLVGSDGSTDRTAELIVPFESARVRTFVFDRNRGKASVLNDLVAAAGEPILVFTDANTMFHADAVERLVAHFADPDVGLVCGELELLAANGNNHDSLYWRLERFLKGAEASIGGLLGANGAIYAIRRELYRPIAPDTITDDFCIAMTVAAEGWKLVYEPQAIATEDTPDAIVDEYHRRVRIGIGNYQALFRHPEYLLRTNWATRFAYVSHKILRWLTPHLLIAALVASALLAWDDPFYRAVLLLQVVAYGVGAFLLLNRLDHRLPLIGAVFVLFLALNWGFLVAFMRFLTGQYAGSWRSTARRSSLPSSSA